MVEFGHNRDQGKELDDLFSILDFPIECLEDDGLEADWECLGPIPSNVLMGPPNDKIDTGFHFLPEPVASTAGAPEQKQLPDHVNTSSSHIPQQNKFAEVQAVNFQTQSPVSVLESSGSCSGQKRLSIKSDNPIPVRSRSKRVRPAGLNPWLLASPEFPTSQKTSNPRKSKESRTNLLQQPVKSSLEVSDCARHPPPVIKKCAHCEATKTPQWREGPLGPKTLCNACGVRYRSGRLFPEYRPAASPTFVPLQHSNSHKKVVEMRTKAKQETAKVKIEEPSSARPKTEEPPTSPQPEFIPMSSYLFDYM